MVAISPLLLCSLFTLTNLKFENDQTHLFHYVEVLQWLLLVFSPDVIIVFSLLIFICKHEFGATPCLIREGLSGQTVLP